MPKDIKREATKNMVCKLLKTLYSLKQSPHLWYKRLLAFPLTKLDLMWIYADHSIFILEEGLKGPILSIFVDNIKIITPKGNEIIEKVKRELIAIFSMIDMGSISFYLELQIDQDQE